jgi:malectin (di-glucose binding ER protein)
MGVTALSEQEREEFDLILQSGIFEKAPRLGRFFRYVCERHFEGQGAQVKEYSIAVEALGRSTDFDPKRDSIVRVEAHRLRKRLEEYYSGAGANHPLRVVIPNGQYRPQFIPGTGTATVWTTTPTLPIDATPAAALPAGQRSSAGETVAPDIPVSESAKRRFPLWLAIVGALLAVATIGSFGLRREYATATKPASELWIGNSSDPLQTEVRLIAGYHGAPFTDHQGRTWGPDAYYSGGVSHPIAAERYIEMQPDSHFIRSQRTGLFHYDIPLRQGTYELSLYFAETDFGRGNPRAGGEGSRVFDISVNGSVMLSGFDPLAEAGGPNRLHTRVLKDVGPAADGKLHLGFGPTGAQAVLNAIEILHSSPGRIHPVRIVTQGSPVVDSDGRIWAADEYFSGGTTVFRRNAVINRPEKAIYEGERYGNFSYRIPVAPGRYRLTLHFAETWFGTPDSGRPAFGERCFNVFANGMALLRDFDIAREAGGANRSITKVFENLEPNAQGVLWLEFVPVKNYAEVNAIEVVETN